jgi:hypothetical protein
MKPLRVSIQLSSPPVLPYPPMLDGLLCFAQGTRMASDSGRTIPLEEIEAEGLPLARVESEAGWWWAASQATPYGPETSFHVNYRPSVEAQARWTREKRVNTASGPDKGLRGQHYARIGMLSLEWTCIGDRAEVEALLSWCTCVGKLGTQGHGAIKRISVQEDDTAPPLSAYGEDVYLRHLPVEVVRGLPPADAQVLRRVLPLRPPYWRSDLHTPCLQVAALWEAA